MPRLFCPTFGGQYTLRLSFTSENRVAPGLLAGLTDQRIARVIRAIHEDPHRRWTLAELAAIACISRSTLAQVFREKTGIPPVEYVTCSTCPGKLRYPDFCS
ncbi:MULTISPECIES: AraC family transcriptional regulator [Enterobacteriaceae]|uniref:AraC family transcriptional regulator n=1 Tax=Enterobacteriaceae TaxID=543 RepID=UPI000C2A968E|nr:hypothetical protein CWM63_27995 [Klebsiella sp. F-Nf9]PKJ70813.1 hypothetical protein CW267_09820 [Klebsiella sp. X1-16S-Nf21]